MSPSSTRSSTPVTVTVLGVAQSTEVNVSEAGAAVPSVASALAIAMVTFAVGCASSTTVNEAVPPASVVTSPAVGATVIPETSSSVLVTATFAASTPP